MVQEQRPSHSSSVSALLPQKKSPLNCLLQENSGWGTRSLRAGDAFAMDRPLRRAARMRAGRMLLVGSVESFAVEDNMVNWKSMFTFSLLVNGRLRNVVLEGRLGLKALFAFSWMRDWSLDRGFIYDVLTLRVLLGGGFHVSSFRLGVMTNRLSAFVHVSTFVIQLTDTVAMVHQVVEANGSQACGRF